MERTADQSGLSFVVCPARRAKSFIGMTSLMYREDPISCNPPVS